MDGKKLVEVVAWLGLPAIMLLCPAPEGLSPKAWSMAAFYIAAIMGLILRPVPDAAVILIVLGAYSVACQGINVALSGYATTTCWLVFAAFLVGRAFIDTGLGTRIGYLLVGKFGHTPLGLGYVAAFTDLAIAPATPSNTARTGGIVFPVFRAVAVTLGSEPGESSRRIGAYLSLLLHFISLCTATMFLTSNATNLLVLSFAKVTYGLEVSWAQYAAASFPICFLLLLLGPWLVYKLYPPTLKTIDNKRISKEGLEKLGVMGYREKMLLVLFLAALVLWSTSNWTKIDNTAVVVAFVGGLLFFRVVTWDTLVAEKSAWTTLIWYGGIIGLAGGLAKEGFFKWLAVVLGNYVSFHGMSPVMIMVLLVAISIPTRYVFASAAAYVSSMIPVFLTLAKIGNVPGMLAFLALCTTYLYFCLLTHFGNAVSPVLFGVGYVDQKTWWGLGFVLSIIAASIMLLLGPVWWSVIGLW